MVGPRAGRSRQRVVKPQPRRDGVRRQRRALGILLLAEREPRRREQGEPKMSESRPGSDTPASIAPPTAPMVVATQRNRPTRMLLMPSRR